MEKCVNEKDAMEKVDLSTPNTPSKPSPMKQQIIDVVLHVGADDVNIGESKILTKPSSSKKRRKNNDPSHERPKKKVYRPKVFEESKTKITKINIIYKSGANNVLNTPKPSTPKKKRSYVRRSASCKHPLFVEDPLSLPFLEKFKALKVEEGGFENSTFKNEVGIEYNLLERYNNATSLSSSCLVESKRIGPNFPQMCKKKRINRERLWLEIFSWPCVVESRKIGANFPKRCKKKRINRGRPRLEKFLIPFIKKGKRTKSFIRLKRKEMRSLIKRIRSLTQKSGQLVPYKKQHLDQKDSKVDIDEETLKVWKLLLHEKEHDEKDEMKRKYWEEERKLYRENVQEFMCHMHLILGDRRFLPWKGSVIDSVVGVYLTQNVSDYLSSSAFMSLASKFPIKTTSCGESIKDLATLDHSHGAKFEKEMEDKKVEEMEGQNAKDSSEVFDNKGTENNSSVAVTKKNLNKEEKEKDKKEKERHWDMLRKMYTKSTRHVDYEDSVDWEAVRCAQPSEIAEAIICRGQQNMIAERVQGLLNQLNDLYGNMDLEWLRYAPPKEAKEYLLNRGGLGLKSVECLRLLTLRHRAFPVDVNVGRIAVRLGWVPLKPLPEPMQIHDLEKFPLPEKIQQYLWPRLCTLDPLILYQLHYQLITFGKVFCTKKNPNCTACPMKIRCKHFLSAIASVKPAIDERPSDDTIAVTAMHQSEPIIEMPASPEPEPDPEPEVAEPDEFEINNDIDIEEFCKHDVSEEILTIKLNSEETHNYSLEDSENDMNIATALVALSADAANIPMPKMKDASRLRTERLVYMLTENHPLLAQHTPRECDDPSPYLLVIWTTGELENSCEPTKNSLQEEETQTVPGTLLIPCRTAMRGRFPLNGTYFQVNEVFADYDSSKYPINVPRKWLWNLEKRVVYFGAGVSSIMKGLSTEEIHNCFWNGFVCVRAMDANTRAPRPLLKIFHRKTANHGSRNKSEGSNEDASE